MSVASALGHRCGWSLPADPPSVRADDGRLFRFCCDRSVVLSGLRLQDVPPEGDTHA
ncbi:MAG: hypothetical protein HQL97_00775 [Magnetococcales bacterium]|nr:hypothetical protein [Magnetococcales bacterium]